MARKTIKLDKVRVEFLLSKAEYNKILDAAKRQGFFSVSEYMRFLLRQSVG